MKKDVPITVGTTATVQGSFTGVSDIQLEGATKGAPPIMEPGPEGVPVIPTKQSGLGAILSNAPLLLERLATLTERLNSLLSDENQRSITGILANTSRMSSDLADATPQVKATLTEMQGTLRQATATMEKFEGVAGKADTLLGERTAKPWRAICARRCRPRAQRQRRWKARWAMRGQRFGRSRNRRCPRRKRRSATCAPLRGRFAR